MRFWQNIRTFLLWSSALWVSACSVNLVQGDQGDKSLNVPNHTQADSAPFFDRIPLILGNDTLWLSEGLRQEYNRAANQDVYPREKCNGSASIRAQVVQNAEATPWSIPLFVIPFWPIMPVDETWTYTLNVQIHCDGVLVKQAEYKEEETVKADLYGKLRSDLLNNASKDMHRKLVQRLAFELNYPYNADMGVRSDY
jgi:hypothetical protein